MVINVQSRKLDRRSFLKFVFPQGEQKSPIIITLPFYENVSITESKEAKLPRYLPVGRPSELHAYAGAKARRFRLRFNLTPLDRDWETFS